MALAIRWIPFQATQYANALICGYFQLHHFSRDFRSKHTVLCTVNYLPCKVAVTTSFLYLVRYIINCQF